MTSMDGLHITHDYTLCAEPAGWMTHRQGDSIFIRKLLFPPDIAFNSYAAWGRGNKFSLQQFLLLPKKMSDI